MRIVTPPATVAVVCAPLLVSVRTASMLQARTAWLSAVSPAGAPYADRRAPSEQ